MGNAITTREFATNFKNFENEVNATGLNLDGVRNGVKTLTAQVDQLERAGLVTSKVADAMKADLTSMGDHATAAGGVESFKKSAAEVDELIGIAGGTDTTRTAGAVDLSSAEGEATISSLQGDGQTTAFAKFINETYPELEGARTDEVVSTLKDRGVTINVDTNGNAVVYDPKLRAGNAFDKNGGQYPGVPDSFKPGHDNMVQNSAGEKFWVGDMMVGTGGARDSKGHSYGLSVLKRGDAGTGTAADPAATDPATPEDAATPPGGAAPAASTGTPASIGTASPETVAAANESYQNLLTKSQTRSATADDIAATKNAMAAAGIDVNAAPYPAVFADLTGHVANQLSYKFNGQSQADLNATWNRDIQQLQQGLAKAATSAGTTGPEAYVPYGDDKNFSTATDYSDASGSGSVNADNTASTSYSSLQSAMKQGDQSALDSALVGDRRAWAAQNPAGTPAQYAAHLEEVAKAADVDASSVPAIVGQTQAMAYLTSLDGSATLASTVNDPVKLAEADYIAGRTSGNAVVAKNKVAALVSAMTSKNMTQEQIKARASELDTAAAALGASAPSDTTAPSDGSSNDADAGASAGTNPLIEDQEES